MKKTALITGASRGIGKELAELFARDGYDLVLVSKELHELQETQNFLGTKYSCQITILAVDLASANYIEEISEGLKLELPKIDVLVNNAGFGVTKLFNEMTTLEMTSLIEVNITALTRLTYLLLPHMLARNSGKILNVASVAAFSPGPYMAVYYATKAYVLSFSTSIYQEYKNKGIHISTLCPGITNTAFMQHSGLGTTSLGHHFLIRMMTPKAVAEAAYDGICKNKRVIIPGTFNKLSVFCMWLLPRNWMGKIISILEKPNTA